jgi:rfaE bifunctional protein nucleotidyltransferase chain/domain
MIELFPRRWHCSAPGDIGLGEVVSPTDLILRRGPWKGDGQVVVCVQGSFDLLHPGHIRLLEQARSFGDILLVGVRNDASVHAALAPSEAGSRAAARPITPASERMEILAALAAVDYVVEFDDRSWPEFCSQLSPDIIVLGAGDEARASAAKTAAPLRSSQGAGCRIATVPLEPGYSTSQLLERIAHPYS